MPTFVYEGPYGALTIGGRTVYRGEPFEEADKSRAAELEAHPDIRQVDGSEAAAAADAPKPKKADLVAKAKALGIPSSGTVPELIAAIAEAEAAAADAAEAAEAAAKAEAETPAGG